MIEKAIAKINAKMQKDSTNQYLELIGHCVIDSIKTELDAEKVLDAEKTLAKAMDVVKNNAQKRAKNGVAAIKDAEVYGWVTSYFGLEAGEEEPKPKTTAETQPKKDTLAINVDDFF